MAGMEQLCFCHQILLAGLKGAGRCPNILANVCEILQGMEETPAGFLESLMEWYHIYPFDLLTADHQSDMIMSFIGQSAPDIHSKLQ